MDDDGSPPNPDTCAAEEWDAYLESADVFSMTQGEADQHRELVERYTARLVRDVAASRAEMVGRLDARDQANTAAEELSERCRDLQNQLIDAADDALDARHEYGYDSSQARAARVVEQQISETLSQARSELADANLRAVQAAKDAR